MTTGYAKMLQGMGFEVGPSRDWPIEWVTFRLHPCPHWPAVENFRESLRIGRRIDPVVLCRQSYTILDGWHRVAAYWLEGRRSLPVRLADMHIGGGKEHCRVDRVDWIHTLKPWSELDCVSGSYLAADWDVRAFTNVRDRLVAFGNIAAPMRLWERVRSVCFLGNVARKKILDVGTRDSLIPHWLARQRAEAHILELNTSLVRDDGTVHIHQGDIRHPPIDFEDETFDAVLCVAVLKSIGGWGDRRAVREMVRILKPGGLLAISVDYGREYLKFPSKVTGVRLYDKRTLYSRIIKPSKCELQGPVNFDRSNWGAWPIKSQSPKAFAAGLNVQVAFILLRKPNAIS